MTVHIWLRHETKERERRTPLTPNAANKLIQLGAKLTVEDDPNRIFPIDQYQKVGCEIVKTGGWKEAPLDSFILGLKEITEEGFDFRHKHIYFAHVYKGQSGSETILKRYQNGGGKLFDLEYLTDEFGKRIAAFGHWAGFAGAAFALDRFYQKQNIQDAPYPGLKSFSSIEELIQQIERNQTNAPIKEASCIIIGAKGRCGRGSAELLEKFGVKITHWDYEETKHGGPFPEILDHDIFVNAALITQKIKPFLKETTFSNRKYKLSMIADVSCDPTSDLNPIPLYSESTTWDHPFYSHPGLEGLEILSVDNLPSTLPKESSEDFCDQLLPHLIELTKKEGNLPIPFQNALTIFDSKFI